MLGSTYIPVSLILVKWLLLGISEASRISTQWLSSLWLHYSPWPPPWEIHKPQPSVQHEDLPVYHYRAVGKTRVRYLQKICGLFFFCQKYGFKSEFIMKKFLKDVRKYPRNKNRNESCVLVSPEGEMFRLKVENQGQSKWLKCLPYYHWKTRFWVLPHCKNQPHMYHSPGQ